MKKTLLLAVISLFSLVSLIGCKDKKVESNEHFGYTLDYIKKELKIDSFDFQSNFPEQLIYSNENGDAFCFFTSHPEKYEYIDYIVIDAATSEDLFSYLEQANQVLDLYSESDSKQLLALCNTDIHGAPISASLPTLFGTENVNHAKYEFLYLFNDNLNKYIYRLRIFA